MRIVEKLRAYAKTVRARKRDAPLDLQRLLRRRPMLLFGVGVFELCQLASGRLDTRLKILAELKAGFSAGAFCVLPER